MKEYLQIYLEEYKSSELAKGGLLEDICDELEKLVKDKIDKWLDEDEI